MKITVVSPFAYPSDPADGAGAATDALIRDLLAAGCDVSAIALCDSPGAEAWCARREKRCETALLTPDRGAGQRFFQHLQGAESLLEQSYRLYRHLARRPSDLICVPDCDGLGYFPIMARRTGTALTATPIAVLCHEPPTKNGQPLDRRGEIWGVLAAQMARFALSQADAALAPHAARADRLAKAGWRDPDAVTLATWPSPDPPAAPPHLRPITRVRYLDDPACPPGLTLFTEAMTRLAQDRADLVARLTVTVAPAETTAAHSDGLGRRLADLPFRCAVTAAGPARADTLDILAPPVSATAHWRLLAAVVDGRPYCALDDEGAAEVAPASRLVRAEVGALAQAIAATLDRPRAPAPAPAPHWPPAATVLCRLARQPTAPRPARPHPPGSPQITVCLLHRDRPDLLDQALEGLSQQTFQDFEVVLLDNASTAAGIAQALDALPGRYPTLSLRILRQDRHLFPAAARNRAAAAARAPILKFHDDDNISFPGELAAFAAAFDGPFDVVSCAVQTFDHNHRPGPEDALGRQIVFSGDLGPINRLYNVMGDSNLAVRRDGFERVGGFPDLGHAYHAEDWLFLAKAAAAGLRLGAIPEPLVWYRRAPHRYVGNWRKLDFDGARLRVNRALDAAAPDALLENLALVDRLSGRSAP